MSQTYMKRQREAAAKAPAGPAPEQEAPALAGLQGSGFEGAVDAIQNVEPHAGRRLSLDDAMAGRMEQQFGIRMDQVELRESPQAEQMDARAFAKGNVVQFAPGQFRPDTEQGRQLIQHELGHVVQQARGGVRADMPGMNLNTDEGLEHQADLGNLSAGGGAPMSVSSLNAETAPVQGGFFSNIKRFFSKAKTSHQVGKGMKRRDEVAEQMTAEHEAEQAEIADVMKAQGYSDEEIQAQLMFQRVNMSSRRADPVNRATADFQDLSMGLDRVEEMDNTFARMGHGTLTQSARERQQQRLDHFNRNVLANGDEDQQAEQMAASLGAKYIPDDMNLAKLDTVAVPSRAGEQQAHRPFTQAQIDNMENTSSGVRGDGSIEERIAPVTAPMKQELGDYFDSLDETGFSYGKAAQGIQEYRKGAVGVKYNKSTIATTKKLMEMLSSHVDQPEMQAMLRDVYGHEMQNPEKMGAMAHSHEDMESRFVKNIMSKGMLPVGGEIRKANAAGNAPKTEFLQRLQSNTAYLESMHDRMGDEDFPEELRDLMASYGPLREKILEAGRGKVAETEPAKVAEPVKGVDVDGIGASNSALKASDAIEKAVADDGFEPGSNGVSGGASQASQASMSNGLETVQKNQPNKNLRRKNSFARKLSFWKNR